TEGFAGSPVDHESEIDVVIGQIHQIQGSKRWLELVCQHARVLRANSERDQRTHVAEDGMFDLMLELESMLVSQHHGYVVLAQLGDHGGHGQRRKALEFIDEDMPIAPPFLLHVGATQCGESDRRLICSPMFYTDGGVISPPADVMAR